MLVFGAALAWVERIKTVFQPSSAISTLFLRHSAKVSPEIFEK
ncbi:MAG: hypothetical protein Q8Q98_16945 [Polaromonas sp.]|nr:hypothetical protein [Polaromonas sp.]